MEKETQEINNYLNYVRYRYYYFMVFTQICIQLKISRFKQVLYQLLNMKCTRQVAVIYLDVGSTDIRNTKRAGTEWGIIIYLDQDGSIYTNVAVFMNTHKYGFVIST